MFLFVFFRLGFENNMYRMFLMNLLGFSFVNVLSMLFWYFYVEIGIFGFGSLVGIIGNVLVIKMVCRVEIKFVC